MKNIKKQGYPISVILSTMFLMISLILLWSSRCVTSAATEERHFVFGTYYLGTDELNNNLLGSTKVSHRMECLSMCLGQISLEKIWYSLIDQKCLCLTSFVSPLDNATGNLEVLEYYPQIIRKQRHI